MALTRITKGVIQPNLDFETRNVNSTGIVTATGLDINGNGDISGNLSVGGVLTYEDVTSIDSVGIITARGGIDCNGDIDVDGHTNLDNVSVAGVSTFSDNVILAEQKELRLEPSGAFKLYRGPGGGGANNFIKSTFGSINLEAANSFIVKVNNSEDSIAAYANDRVDLYHNNQIKLTTTAKGIQVGTGVTIETNGQANFVGVTTFGNLVGGATTSVVVNRDLVLRDSWGYGNHIKFHWNTNTINFPSASLSNIARVPNLSFGDRTNNGNQIGIGDFLMYHDYYNMHMMHFGLGGLYLSNKNTILGIRGANGSGQPQNSILIHPGANQGVKLYHGGNLKFETAGIGASVYGTLVATGADINGDLDVDGHTNLDNVSIAGVTTTTDDIIIGADNKKLKLGVGEELQLYQAGNHSIIQHNGGHYLLLRSNSFGIMDAAGTKNMFTGFPDTHTSMYYNGSYKIRTQNTGAEIVGTVVATGADINGDIDVDGHTNLDNVSIVGIATVTGSSQINFGSGTTQLQISNSNDSDINHNESNGSGMRFRINGQTQMVVKTDSITYGTNTHNYYTNRIAVHSGDSDTHISFPTNDTITFDTNGSERLRIDSSGNMSLGKGAAASTNYGQNFQIHSNSTNGAALHLTDNSTGNSNSDGFHIISTSSIAYLWQRENANMIFGTNSSSRWNIYGSNGHFAPSTDSTYDIGTSSVRVRNGYFDTLYGDGSNLTGISGVTINNNADNRVITGSGTAATLNGEANLTWDGSKLLVGATSSAAGNLVVKSADSSSNQVWVIGRSSDNTGSVSFRNNGDSAYTGRIEVEDTNGMILQVGSSDRLQIDTAGQVLPGADDAQNLGSSTKRWKNIYAADMHFSNKGKTNDVDGTWGDWTLQEGEDSVFMINNRTGKKYAITMKEVN